MVSNEASTWRHFGLFVSDFKCRHINITRESSSWLISGGKNDNKSCECANILNFSSILSVLMEFFVNLKHFSTLEKNMFWYDIPDGMEEVIFGKFHPNNVPVYLLEKMIGDRGYTECDCYAWNLFDRLPSILETTTCSRKYEFEKNLRPNMFEKGITYFVVDLSIHRKCMHSWGSWTYRIFHWPIVRENSFVFMHLDFLMN